MIKCRWREFRREPSAFFFVILFPVLLILGLGHFADGPPDQTVNFYVPGILAFSILTSSLHGTGMTLVVGRRNKLYKRFQCTPMSMSEWILSHIVGRFVILAWEGGALLLTAYFVFGYIPQNWIGFLTAACVGTACCTSLAFLLGSRTDDTGFYFGITNLVIIPMMLGSGLWFDRSRFPIWLQSLTDVLPLTPLVEALRQTGSGLQGAWDVWPLALIMVAYGLVFGGLAKSMFRWQ